MVQVDVFWSYGLAAGITLAGAKRLKREPERTWVNDTFVGTMLWTSLVFAPSGMVLLWDFPYWETMFVARDWTSIPSWLVALFGITNVTQAILAYWVTRRAILKGQTTWAKWQPALGWGGMLFILVVGWDGSGYKRFFYPGTGEDWAQGTVYPISAWFSSPVFYTLLALAAAFIPTYVYTCKKLLKDSA